MATPSPYRSLPVDRRVAIVTHSIKANREARALFVQRLMMKRGGVSSYHLATVAGREARC